MGAHDCARCLVLGGSGTLGRAVCETLCHAGARVSFTFSSGHTAARELKERFAAVQALRLDLGGGDDVAAAVRGAAEEMGGLDAFIHCAAIGAANTGADFPRASEIDTAEWDRVLAVNVRSAFLGAAAAARAMAPGGGNVVFVGSIDGLKRVPAPVHYAASKGALAALTRALAKELGSDGIRVNLVAPGVMEGGLSSGLPKHHRGQYLKHCSLGRLAEPAEIASVVAWLALENTYLNGECVVADGGL